MRAFTKIFGWVLIIGVSLYLAFGGYEQATLNEIILVATYFIMGAILAK